MSYLDIIRTFNSSRIYKIYNTFFDASNVNNNIGIISYILSSDPQYTTMKEISEFNMNLEVILNRLVAKMPFMFSYEKMKNAILLYLYFKRKGIDIFTNFNSLPETRKDDIRRGMITIDD